MKNCFAVVVLLLCCSLLRAADRPLSLSGTYRVGTSQAVYKKLTNIASALNNTGNTVTGDVIFELDSDYDGTSGETFPIVFKKFNSTGNWTVTIRPKTGVSLRTTSGDPGANAYLIQLEDADHVQLDGRPGGTGTDIRWLIRNTRTASAGGSINLKSDASHNIFTYLQLEAQSASPNAVLYLGEGSAQGNDSNTVSYCTIRDRSDVTATLTAGIMSKSTQVFLAYNSGNIITYNNFINIYNNGGAGYGIYLADGTMQTEVTYNNFYQTRPVVNASSGTAIYAIYASQVNMANMNIANNFIGGTAPGCGGSYFSLAGAVVRFGGIVLTNTSYGQGPGNVISDNMIRNLEVVSDASPTGAQGLFTGIQADLGYTDIVNNMIGSTVYNHAIRLVVNGGSNVFTSHGISHGSKVGGAIKGNTIAGITIDGTLKTSGLSTFNGININYSSPSSSVNVDISDNLIGSKTMTSSIQVVSDSMPVSFRGIYVNAGGSYGRPVYKKNTVSNILLNYKGEGSGAPVVTGIYDAAAHSITTLDSNTVSHIYVACLKPAASSSFNFQGITTSGANSITVKNNIVTELHLTNAGSIDAGFGNNTSVVGISVNGYNEPAVYGNRVSKLSSANNLGTATATLVIGIDARSATKVYNNLVSLDNGSNTNNCEIKCIRGVNGQVKIYYNDLYIAGSNGDASNTAISALIARANSYELQVKNNILYNARTGGNGAHFAYHNGSSSPADNWTMSNIDNNLIVLSSLDKVGRWGGSDYNQTQWKNTGGDKIKSIFYTVAGLPTSVLFGNMTEFTIHDDAWNYVKGKGTNVPNVTTDFTGASRNTSTPTIGAYEYIAPIPPPFLSGTYLVGSSQPYFKKLTDIAAALSASTVTVTGDLVFELDSDYNGTVGETFPIYFKPFTTSGGDWKVVIRPKAGVSLRTTAGNPGDNFPLISLQSIDNVTFDGRPGGAGTNTGWIIRNTNTTYPISTIYMGYDASNNTLTWLQAEGQPSGSHGIITIGPAINTGNENITISYCTIRNRTDTAGRMAAKGIVSSGSTSSVDVYNSGLTITHNNFINIYHTGASVNMNIMLDVGTTASSVTYNNIYLEGTFVNSSGSTIEIDGIYVRDQAASNVDISHNFIGGTAPGCGGAPYTIQGSGLSRSSLLGIVFFSATSSSTGTGNTVADNTITNMDIQVDDLTLSGYRMFTGISINNTQLQVANNKIGDRSIHDAILLTANGVGNQAVTAVAIRFLSPTGGSITGNEIGGITFDGNLNSTAMGMFIGINVDMNPAPNMEFAVTGNMIGSTTVPDNIRTLSPGMPINIYPIYTSVNTPAVLNVSDNAMAGIQSAYNGVGASPTFYGIRHSGTASAVIRHNTIADITAVSPGKMTAIELSTTATGTAAFTIRDNNIHGLRLTGTDPVAATLASNSIITGIYSYGTDAGPIVYGNRIYDLTSGNTFTAATPAAFTTIRGIWLTGKYTAYNNLVSLTNGNNTNNCSIAGLWSTGYSTKSDQFIYHNSFYTGGSNGDASNTAPSYVAGRSSTNAAMRIKNNLLVNDRSGGGAPGYIFYNALSSPQSNWALGASDNNTIVTARVNAIGMWNTSTLDSTQWQTTGGDANSVFYTTSQVSAANLFVNAATGDLAIKENARNYVAAKGTTGTGITTDFAGTTRSTTTPSAGAYEYEYVPVNNNAPTGLAISASAIEENKPAGSAVGVFTATDPDAGDTFTYSLVSGAGSSGNEAFTITGDVLTINFSPDYETQSSYSIRVRVTDQGALYYEKVFTITITDMTEQAPNHAPTGLALSAASIEENKPAGSTVGLFTATDTDAGDTFTYSLVSGAGSTDNAAFTITGDALSINASPDFETQSSYSIRVRVTDQGTLYYEKEFTIIITDLNEQAPNTHAPVITSHGGAASATLNVPENQTVVTTVTATDADAGATITYSLVGNDDDSYFTVNAATGELVFNTAPDFEHPSDLDENNMYMVTVQASDGTFTAVQRFKVRVTNVNDNAPEFGSFDGDAAVTLKMAENTAIVGTVWAVDKEPGTTITYSILSNNEGALFSINPSGVLRFITAPDYENPLDEYAGNVYIVTVQASDGELASVQRFKIKISDVNEGTGRMNSYNSSVAELVEETAAGKGINVYPNPVTGKRFTLQVNDLPAGKYTLELYSLTGQLVCRRMLEYTGKSISYPVQLPASLTRGMYVLKLAGAGVLHREKLMIE